MTTRFLLFTTAAALSGLSLASGNHLHADAHGPRTLISIVGAQSLTRDPNGNGLADVVAARVIAPASPSQADVEAATNLAARLGYETTALTLPLAVRDNDVADPAAIGVPILVRTGLNQRRLTPPIDLDELAVDSPGANKLTHSIL